MKSKRYLLPSIMFLFLFLFSISFVSTAMEYRWGNVSATCILATGSPDNVSITSIGVCIVESFNLTELNPSLTYNTSYVYVWRVGALADDSSIVAYCNDVPSCSSFTTLRTYNNTNTPVDFYTNGSSVWQKINVGYLNFSQLSNTRLELDYVKVGGSDSQNDIDALGLLIDIPCAENWIDNSTACNILDNRTKLYYDGNACGTNTTLPADNGTIVYCDYCVQTWECSVFDSSCGGSITEIGCIDVDYQNNSCCLATNLSSDCDYLSIGNYSDFDKYCGVLDITLFVPTYPYVDFNVTYPMELVFTQNNISVNLTNFYLNLTDPDANTSLFNFTWDDSSESYKLNLLFIEEGNYPFKIFADYPYDDIPEIAGTLIVRKPYYITFEGYKTKSQDVYKNNFAYFTAEFSSSKKYYDPILEQFIVPLLFSKMYNISVLNAPYNNGVATLKLWETGKYAIRMVDGDIAFSGVYVVPNVSKGYGVNSFIGEYNFNGSNQTYKVYLDEKDINQFRWLFNWIFVIALVLIFATSIFLFFVIPQHSQISILFGLGFTSMLVLLRIVFFVWKGW